MGKTIRLLSLFFCMLMGVSVFSSCDKDSDDDDSDESDVATVLDGTSWACETSTGVEYLSINQKMATWRTSQLIDGKEIVVSIEPSLYTWDKENNVITIPRIPQEVKLTYSSSANTLTSTLYKFKCYSGVIGKYYEQEKDETPKDTTSTTGLAAQFIPGYPTHWQIIGVKAAEGDSYNYALSENVYYFDFLQTSGDFRVPNLLNPQDTLTFNGYKITSENTLKLSGGITADSTATVVLLNVSAAKSEFVLNTSSQSVYCVAIKE